MIRVKELNFKELYACITVAYVSMLNGIDKSFPSGIKNHMGNVSLNLEQRSIVGSMNLYATAVSTLLLLAYINRLGRKKVILFCLFLYSLAWIGMFFFSHRLDIIYICRFLSGTAGGMRNASLTYMSESGYKKRRGRLLSVFGLSSSFGIALSFVIESLFSWRVVAVAGIIISVSGLFQVNFLPESKYWYLLKNDTERARSSILWFEPSLSMADVDAEIDDIRTTQTRYKTNLNIFQLLSQKSILRNACLVIFMLTFRCGIGRLPMTAEPQDFFDSFDLPFTFKTLNIVQGILEVGSSVLYLMTADRVKRRTILQICCWLINVSLLIVFVMNYFQLGMHPIDKWIMLVALLIYYSIVVGYLFSSSSVVVSEVASSCTAARAPIVSVTYFVNDSLGAFYVTIFPTILQNVGIYFVIAYFVINSCLLSLTVCFIPETIGKGLHHCHDNVNESEIRVNNTKL